MVSPLVSIIIPVYNVQQYLTICVESALAQTYGQLEIILVDDGSTDGSGKLCDAFLEKDCRIQVIHQPNGGLSSARNAGVAACSGDFIFYLDSDDYLEPNAVLALMHIQSEHHADAVIGNYYYTYANHEDLAQPDSCVIQKYTKAEAISLLMQGQLQTFAWGKMIRADIAKRHLFPVGKLFEDHFWTHLIFQDCETIVYASKPVVHYRQRENSISFTFNLNRLDILDGWQARIIFLQQTYPDMTDAYLRRCAEDMRSLAWLVLTRMKQNRKQGFIRLRQFIQEYHLASYCCKETQRLIRALQKSNLLYAVNALYFRILRG